MIQSKNTMQKGNEKPVRSRHRPLRIHTHLLSFTFASGKLHHYFMVSALREGAANILPICLISIIVITWGHMQ